MEIQLKSKQISNDDFIKKLESQDLPNSINFILKKRENNFRGLDPTVMVAIVSSAGTALGALINGVLNIAKEKGSNSIVIQDKNGRRVEFPANCSKEKIEEIIHLLNQMEAPKIELP